MKSPHTYFEWKELLDKFSSGEDTVISFMSEGSVTLDSGTATSYMVLFEAAYKKRKQLWLDKFKALTHQYNIRSYSDFSVAAAQAKLGLRHLVLYTELKPFHNDLKMVLQKDLKFFIDEIRKSLRENALREKSNQLNALLLIFENFNLGSVSSPLPPTTAQQINPVKKKIIF